MLGARVLIADDHAPTRLRVRQSLEEDGFVVCAFSGRPTAKGNYILTVSFTDGRSYSAYFTLS